MNTSIFELFSIGVGPSSSHTVGPMRATYNFVELLKQKNHLSNVTRVQIELFGSLALTGIGHGTNKAALMGLLGNLPESVNPDLIDNTVEEIHTSNTLTLNAKHQITFNPLTDLLWQKQMMLPYHSNGMQITAFNNDEILEEQIYYSIGGGFIVNQSELGEPKSETTIPYPFETSAQLLTLCRANNLTIAELMLENEKVWNDEETIREQILKIAATMNNCIDKGCTTKGILPGGLEVKRRAANLYEKLSEKGKPLSHEQSSAMDWLNMYAIAVNEENAAGGRIVTAPTNGAAGIIPAVLRYYLDFYPNSGEDDIIKYLLTAAAITILYKKGASISGAEVGCQGEIGVAASMAAGALTAILGGTIAQIENAAEIGMEHHLGMTCDPVKGLVQVPCIERNAMGAVKAINASRLALMGDGTHTVSLDQVIATMRQTGKDMMRQYKETSLGGLAVNVIEC